jgi:hypothetical protein
MKSIAIERIVQDLDRGNERSRRTMTATLPFPSTLSRSGDPATLQLEKNRWVSPSIEGPSSYDWYDRKGLPH